MNNGKGKDESTFDIVERNFKPFDLIINFRSFEFTRFIQSTFDEIVDDEEEIGDEIMDVVCGMLSHKLRDDGVLTRPKQKQKVPFRKGKKPASELVSIIDEPPPPPTFKPFRLKIQFEDEGVLQSFCDGIKNEQNLFLKEMHSVLVARLK